MDASEKMPRRNPMTADTDPTDEELAIVMREACERSRAADPNFDGGTQ